MCVNPTRDSEKYIRFADAVLHDHEIPEADFVGGWFEDIVAAVIKELEGVKAAWRRATETLNLVSYLKDHMTVPMDEGFKHYLETGIHANTIKAMVRSQIGYSETTDFMKEFMDNVLDGKDVLACDARSQFVRIACVVHEVIKQARVTYDSIVNAKGDEDVKSSDGFDIYAWAEQYPGADYLDQNTGYIYRCADYMRAIKFGLPTLGIAVVDSTGAMLGYAVKME